MLRFLISFIACITATVLAAWGLASTYPEFAAESGYLVGLAAGGGGCIVFWLTYGALLAFTDLE